MKKTRVGKFLAFAFLILGTIKAFGATYIVPPDIDNIRQSATSDTVITVTSTSPYRLFNSIVLAGASVSVPFRCEAVRKIVCKTGTPNVFVNIARYQAFTSDSSPQYLPVSTTGTMLYANDITPSGAIDPNYFYICTTLITTDGNALLTERNSSSGSSYDSSNPSYAIVQVRQTCP